VLLDYQRTGVAAAREPEVLSTMATIVNKLGNHITSEVPKIFDAVFECTLQMINKDFEEYPEHRTNFFLLLQVSPPPFYFYLPSILTYVQILALGQIK
jgi:exportin-1